VQKSKAIPAVPAAAEYKALLVHCSTCRACHRNTAVACPEAGRLRRAWSSARRADREGVRR
jgi:cytochrome c5